MNKDYLVPGIFTSIIGFALVMAKLSGEAAAPEDAIVIGGCMMVVGVIMFIGGLVTPSKQEPQTPTPNAVAQPETSSSVEPIVLVICPNCKVRVPSMSKFCPECGESLGSDSS
ncbi:MAG: hypothetical protein NWE89_02235 [Candidatus Bathyarchaeota archaeon]|nr:hypothetical protein [Candidatus Bathyarchaeota archaeon]